MTVPTNHTLTVTDQHGATIRGKVVFIQRIMEGSAEVHIITSGWLDPYRYRATYSAPTQSVSGFYVLLSYKLVDGQWLFRGVFEKK